MEPCLLITLFGCHASQLWLSHEYEFYPCSSRFISRSTTATEREFLSRVNWRTFHESFDTKKTLRWSVIWARWETLNPFLKVITQDIHKVGNIVPLRADIGIISLKSICVRKCQFALVDRMDLVNLIDYQDNWTLVCLRRSIIILSTLTTRLIRWYWLKRTVSNSRRLNKQIPT